MNLVVSCSRKTSIDELPRNDKKHKDVPMEFGMELYLRQRKIDDLCESKDFFSMSEMSAMFVSNPKAKNHHGVKSKEGNFGGRASTAVP